MLLVKGKVRGDSPLAFLFAKLFLWAMPKKKRKQAERAAGRVRWLATSSEV
jgi:hypothetical protein